MTSLPKILKGRITSERMALSGAICTREPLVGVIPGTLEISYTDDLPAYKGDYIVTPTVDGQVLATAQKLMVDDMTIKAIPFYKVSNNTGGSTVYIAKEIEIT